MRHFFGLHSWRQMVVCWHLKQYIIWDRLMFERFGLSWRQMVLCWHLKQYIMWDKLMFEMYSWRQMVSCTDNCKISGGWGVRVVCVFQLYDCCSFFCVCMSMCMFAYVFLNTFRFLNCCYSVSLLMVSSQFSLYFWSKCF